MFEAIIPSEEDADRIATVHLAAMENNPLLPLQFPTPQSLETLHGFLKRDTVAHLRSHRKGVLVATNGGETREIVGFIKWEVVSEDDGEEKGEEEEEDWPSDCDRRWVDEYYRHATRMQEDATKGLPSYCHISFLCTDPVWQGRGIGSLLSQEVLQWAQDHGMPVYLEGTREATNMYMRLGFKVVGKLEMEIPKAVYEESGMLWIPPGQAGVFAKGLR